MAMRAKFTLITAVSLAGCATPDSQLAKHSPKDLQRRHAELTQRIMDDELEPPSLPQPKDIRTSK
jgi:hypothetical protein